MRTRTLLMLAVACAVAILVAGTVFLIGLAGEDEVTLLDVGDRASVGDAAVRLVDYAEDGATAVATVEIGGVDDPDGAAAFRLVVPGESLRARRGGDSSGAAERCDEVTVEATSCTLTFDLGDAAGGSRVLLYRRGDAVARWQLLA